MKEYGPGTIRNIAFIGHGGSGKTSFSELMLFTAEETNRIGNIEEGNTVSDFGVNEVEKQISLSTTPLHVEWKEKKINILDTPGYSDFIGQVKAGLHVVDTAVSFVKANDGVEVGTEQTWEFVKEYNLPAAIVLNKCDNEHSKFEETLEMVKERLSNDATIVTFPVNEGVNFDTVVDLIEMKAYKFGEAGSKKVEVIDIPGDVKDKADQLREELIEKVAESDEELMEKFFEEGTLADEDLANGLKKAILSSSLIPVFAAAATKGVGADNFMNFVINYLPAPNERGSVEADKGDEKVEIKCDPNEDPALFVFKSMSEAHVGEMSIFKVYSGELHTGLDLQNPKRDKTERMGQIYVLNGKHRKEVSKILAGDIGAVVKLKDTHTTDTLCSKKLGITLPPINFPQGVIRGAVKPKAKGDEDKIAQGLHTIHEEDPTLISEFDPELSQTIVSGQGELQLDLAVKMLKDRFKVEVELIEPRIPYRETIKGSCENAEYRHKKQSGGRGQFGHVYMKIEPQPRGKGYEFVDAIVGGAIPGRFVPAVEKGLNEVLEKGILTGSRVIDVKVTLYDGNFHPVDSDEVSFKLAASQAFRKGFKEANPMILEPIYKITVKVPEEYMGDVMGDISSRRGKILGMDAEGPWQIINGLVPLAELYKYSTHLRSITQGRGIHSREFHGYEAVPKEVEAKIIEEYEKSKEEE